MSDVSEGADHVDGHLNYAADLVRIIKEEFGDHFVVGVAGEVISTLSFFMLMNVHVWISIKSKYTRLKEAAHVFILLVFCSDWSSKLAHDSLCCSHISPLSCRISIRSSRVHFIC